MTRMIASLTPRRLLPLFLWGGLLALATREISDPDLWWHLRTGQLILDTGQIPRADPFSFTVAGQAWIAHEWLSEIFLYALFRWAGLAGPLLAFAAVVTLAFALVYLRTAPRPHLAVFTTLLGALASAVTWGPRPQMLTLLLASLLLFLLDAYRRGQARVLWAIPPLFLLWANLHSGYFLGLVLLGIRLVGETTTRLLHRAGVIASAPDLTVPQLRRLSIAALASILAAIVNPNTLELLAYPFFTLTSRAMQTYIQEWFSPDFHNSRFWPFALLLFGTFTALSVSRRAVNLTDLLMLLGFGFASLVSARNIPIFALVAPPVLGQHVAYWWRGDSMRLLKRQVTSLKTQVPSPKSQVSSPKSRVPGSKDDMGLGTWDMRLAALNWAILALLIVGVVGRAGTVLRNVDSTINTIYPVAAAEYLLAARPSGPMFNSYNWGGYLVWRLWPTYPVFIDGRADVYGDAFIEDYMLAFHGTPRWREPLNRYGVRLVFIERDRPLSALLAASPDWRQVYADALAVIYSRP